MIVIILNITNKKVSYLFGTHGYLKAENEFLLRNALFERAPTKSLEIIASIKKFRS